jgi:hypothetical protein
MPGHPGVREAVLRERSEQAGAHRRRAEAAAVRDWRGIKAVIGDRVYYVTVDGADKPEMHEAWVEEAGESYILVRPTASAFGGVGRNGGETHRLKQPEDFVVVKGQGFL